MMRFHLSRFVLAWFAVIMVLVVVIVRESFNTSALHYEQFTGAIISTRKRSREQNYDQEKTFSGLEEQYQVTTETLAITKVPVNGCLAELKDDFYVVGRRLTVLNPEIEASCKQLAEGDITERKRVREAEQQWTNNITDAKFLETLVSCSETRPTFLNNFYISNKELKFPLAFVMLICYENNSIQQYIRLLRYLYRPHNVYCIHIDQKAPTDWIAAVTKATTCFPNILIAKEAVEVVYASSSILAAHMACLKELSKSHLHWMYAINLHGTELPLVTNREMVELLMPLGGINAVARGSNVNGVDDGSITHRRITQKATYTPGRGVELTLEILGPVPYNLSIYKSADSPNSAFSKEFVHFMITDPRAIALFKYLQNVQSAVEFFFSTLNNLSDAPGGREEYSKKPKDEHPRLPTVSVRSWQKDQINPSIICPDNYYRHHICILSVGDLYRLKIASTNLKYFFYNKYLINYDHVVMNCMEEMLLERNLREYEKDCLN